MPRKKIVEECSLAKMRLEEFIESEIAILRYKALQSVLQSKEKPKQSNQQAVK